MQDSNDSTTMLPLLTSGSFARWKFEMMIILESRDLMNIVIGKEPEPRVPTLTKLPKVSEDPTTRSKQKEYDDIMAENENLKQNYYQSLKSFNSKEAKAKELLSRSCDDSHHSMIRSCTKASEIWQTLCNLYEQKTTTNVFLAQRQFHE